MQFGAVVLISIGIAFDKYLLFYFSPIFYIFIAFLGLPLPMLLMRKEAVPDFFWFLKNIRKNYKIIGVTLLLVIGAVSLMFAYKTGGEISRITPITGFGTVLLVVGGIVFLKERDHLWKKIVATLFGIIGVILLTK